MNNEVITFHVTAVLPTGSGFAVHASTGESIYIPPSVTKKADIVPGSTRRGTVVPNNSDRTGAPPWMCAFAVIEGLEEGETKEYSVDREAVKAALVSDGEGIYSTDEISVSVRASVDHLFPVLLDMAAKREIAHAVLMSPELHMWAINRGVFI